MLHRRRRGRKCAGATVRVRRLETGNVGKSRGALHFPSEKSRMEATRQGWFERRDVIGSVLKFGELVQRVRTPFGQSEDPQAGSEPCDVTGNRDGDA
jgi:hypothetical protein